VTRFYLGSHHASQRWYDLDVPLFVSRRVLTSRKTLPQPATGWALDSGGFTELSMFGEWRTTEAEYAADVRRFQQMGGLEWVAPQTYSASNGTSADSRGQHRKTGCASRSSSLRPG
jgi:hypothetical protein